MSYPQNSTKFMLIGSIVITSTFSTSSNSGCFFSRISNSSTTYTLSIWMGISCSTVYLFK